MGSTHDFHVIFNEYNPLSDQPWLVENSTNCVVCRHATKDEADKCVCDLDEEINTAP